MTHVMLMSSDAIGPRRAHHRLVRLKWDASPWLVVRCRSSPRRRRPSGSPPRCKPLALARRSTRSSLASARSAPVCDRSDSCSSSRSRPSRSRSRSSGSSTAIRLSQIGRSMRAFACHAHHGVSRRGHRDALLPHHAPGARDGRARDQRLAVTSQRAPASPAAAEGRTASGATQ
jgi:hypothetical protein